MPARVAVAPTFRVRAPDTRGDQSSPPSGPNLEDSPNSPRAEEPDGTEDRVSYALLGGILDRTESRKG